MDSLAGYKTAAVEELPQCGHGDGPSSTTVAPAGDSR